MKRKLPLALTLFLLITTLLVVWAIKTGRFDLRKRAQEEKNIFSDDFERSDFFAKSNWQTRGLNTNFKTSLSIKFSGKRSLTIKNNGASQDQQGGGLQAITHQLNNQNAGIAKVAFFEYGDSRSDGSIFSITDEEGNYLMLYVDSSLSTKNFMYRVGTKKFETHVPRTPGWHILEFVITPYGSYGKIDGYPLSDFDINFKLKRLSKVNLGRGWAKNGISFFDTVKVENLFSIPQQPQQILDSWSDKVYNTYKDTDLTGVLTQIKSHDNSHCNTSAARTIAGQAMMHAYYFSRDNNPNDLAKAKKYINALINSYDHWNHTWLSQITTNQLAFTTWWLWNYLDTDTKQKFFNLMTQEANFWTEVLEEIQQHPWEKTLANNPKFKEIVPCVIGQSLPNCKRCYNLEVITSASNDNKGDADRYKTDTKAEEINTMAQLLATAYSMFPNYSQAKKWNEAAKCYAFHTINNGEEKCGIKGKTIYDDFSIANHYWAPNWDYAFAAITGLQQGEFSYLLANQPTPSEFHHNIERKTESLFWQKNITDCRVDDTFRTSCDACVIYGKKACEKERNNTWSERNLKVGLFILPYWIKMNNDQNSQKLFNQLANYIYFLNKDLIKDAYPFNQPIKKINQYSCQINDESYYWWKNVERYAQVSAKYYVLNNFKNASFRSKYFPKNPEISSLKTCSIQTPQKIGKLYTVNFSGNDRHNGQEPVRLWLETPTRSKINKLANSGMERKYGNDYYYFLKQTPANGHQEKVTISGLPAGTYYLHCDLPNQPNRCSGNPFCNFEGGPDNCDGWISCSEQDHTNLIVLPTPTPSGGVTPSPQPLNCASSPRLCWFGKTQCEQGNQGKTGGQCVKNIIGCGNGKYWNWSYCYDHLPTPALTTPTTTPTASPAPIPTGGACFVNCGHFGGGCRNDCNWNEEILTGGTCCSNRLVCCHAIPTPPPNKGQLVFQFKLQGEKSQRGEQTIMLTLKQAGEIKYQQEITAQANSQGIYTGRLNDLPPGNYTAYLKGETQLQKKLGQITINQGETTKAEWTAQPLLAGDFNNDNILNIFDLALIVQQYTQLTVPTNNQNQKYDVNSDGVIDITDIALVLQNYTSLQIKGD